MKRAREIKYKIIEREREHKKKNRIEATESGKDDLDKTRNRQSE